MNNASTPGALRHGTVTRAKRRNAARWRIEHAAMMIKLQRDLDMWKFQREAFMNGVVPLPAEEQPSGLLAMFSRLFKRES